MHHEGGTGNKYYTDKNIYARKTASAAALSHAKTIKWHMEHKPMCGCT